MMRIFCAIRHSHDPGKFYGGLWSNNFYPALRELGCEVIESQTDLLPTSRFMEVPGDFTTEELAERQRTSELILEEVKSALKCGPVHLFLSYFYNSHFDPAAFEELRRIGVPSVNFYCNSIYQFDLVSAVAAKADFSWHTERDAGGFYRSVGAKPVWVQMGADPKIYHPVSSCARTSRACFVGQRYADRDRWLAELVRAKVPVDIYGHGWGAGGDSAKTQLSDANAYLGRPRYKPGSTASYLQAAFRLLSEQGILDGMRRGFRQAQYRKETKRLRRLLAPHTKGVVKPDAISATLAQYGLCLNFSNVWADGRPGSKLIPHVRLRDFEGPMSRTCYLTGHTSEIAEFYQIGKEIETYRTPAELVEKAHFYLTHPKAAEKLRDAGHRRALRDHTWTRRFEELFAKIGLNTN